MCFPQNEALPAWSLRVSLPFALGVMDDLSVKNFKRNATSNIYYFFNFVCDRITRIISFLECSSSSEQKKNMSEAVEELQYRCSLKIALDILHQTDSDSQVPPAEGPNPEFSRENGVGSAPPTPSRSSSLRSRSKKLEAEAAKRERKPQNNYGLKGDPKARSQRGSVAPEGSGKARGSGTNPSKAHGSGASPARARGGGTNSSRCGARDSCVAPAPGSHNCKKPEPKSSARQRKIQPEMGNGVSCKPKVGRSQQGRKRGCRDDSPRDQAQLAPEEGSPPVPSKSVTLEPPRKTGTQPGRTSLDSSCESASDELEKSISSESESLAKQLDGRREAEGGKHLGGAGVASGTDRKCRNHSGSSPGPSGASSQPLEEENQDPSHLPGNKAPDSEEDEGGQIPWGRETFIPYSSWNVALLLEKRLLDC